MDMNLEDTKNPFKGSDITLQLLSRYDLWKYLSFRIADLQLDKYLASTTGRPDKRGLLEERFNGRLRELRKMKRMLEQNGARPFKQESMNHYARYHERVKTDERLEDVAGLMEEE